LVLRLLVLAQLGIAPDSSPAVRFELPNGLRVWVREDHTRPVALVQVTYKVGSLHESAGHTGIAHYVEHMVYRAAKQVSNEDVYGYIDRIGGRYTGGTWPEMTQYTETVPSWALESALRVTAQRMCCALFDSLEFERERSNVVTEANGFAEFDAINVFRDAMMAASFELHPYRYGSNTWARDNLVLTRAAAYDWYKRYYGPNNAVLVVVGDVDVGTVRTLVDKHFATIPRATETGAIALREPTQLVEKRITVRHSGPQRQLAVYYQSPAAADSAFPALVVLARHLRGRVPVLVREKFSSATVTVADSAAEYPHVLRISADGDSTADLDRILHVMDGEIDRIAAAGLAPDELEAARRAPTPTQAGSRTETQGGGVPPRRSSLTQLADSLTNVEVFPWEVGPALRSRISAATARVTGADIRAFAAEWLQRGRRTIGFLLTDPTTVMREVRLDVPPLRTPPEKRKRPEAVPGRALQPLAPIDVPRARRVLANGVSVRAARSQAGAGAPHVRVAFETSGDSARLAQLLDANSVLRRHRARISWSYQGVGRTRDSAHAGILRALGVRPGSDTQTGGAVVVAAVGPAEPGELLDAVALVAQRLPARPRRPRSDGPTQVSSQREQRLRTPDARQVSVYAGLPGVARDHPDRRALELLNYIVGVPSYGGRLGWALTKAGLTYSSAATTTFSDAGGTIVFGTRCDTRNTDATVQAIREVIEGVAARGVEEWELREAQAFMLGRNTLYGARAHSDPRVIATALVDSELGALDHLDLPAFSRAYLSISIDELNLVARRYYRPELLQVVAVGALPMDREQVFPAGTFRSLFDPL
jgi:zinc protease